MESCGVYGIFGSLSLPVGDIPSEVAPSRHCSIRRVGTHGRWPRVPTQARSIASGDEPTLGTR